MARREQRPEHERGLRILLLPFTHFRQLDNWRRVALGGAVIVMIGSVLSFPDFGWIEAAQLLVAISCLRMLARYVETNQFASPFADGTLLAVGGLWTALIALGNALFDDASPRSEIVVVLGCAALFLAGMIIRWNEGPRWYEHDYAS
ncbi:MAG: hypothetical protein JHC98_09525 [Thermoleophilaceae bacterium]|nr:hypothetical protein [Thermoleophilaceae bacterium]